MSNLRIICANIIEKNGKYLVVQETKEVVKGRYNFPAGKLEDEETLIQCAIRETKEETGFDVKPLKFVGIYQTPLSRQKHNVSVLVFYSEIIGGELTTSDDTPEVKFVSYEEIEELEKQDKLRSGYMMPALEHYRKGRVFDLDIIENFTI